ncbi:MAG: hypothetical protein KDD42_09310, partial [Bdellovibrionales bacterium]|nr:hypothetical protein [Bdellovibrionales bacterium]
GVSDAAGLDSELDYPWEMNGNIVYNPIENLDFFITGRNLTNEKNALQGFISPNAQEGARGYGGVRYRF